jgi:hypothetical protein
VEDKFVCVINTSLVQAGSEESMLLSRRDLNNPPIAVGGIFVMSLGACSIKDLNNPPTAAGGIPRYTSQDDTRNAFE